jgi:putative transposase
VKEARKKLKKGIVSREAVRKANPIIPRPAVYAVWVSFRSLKVGDKRPAVLAWAAPMTPARGDGAMNRPSGRGAQMYNDTDTKAGF